MSSELLRERLDRECFCSTLLILFWSSPNCRRDNLCYLKVSVKIMTKSFVVLSLPSTLAQMHLGSSLTRIFTRMVTYDTFFWASVKSDLSRYIMKAQECGFVQKGPNFLRQEVEVTLWMRSIWPEMSHLEGKLLPSGAKNWGPSGQIHIPRPSLYTYIDRSDFTLNQKKVS